MGYKTDYINAMKHIAAACALDQSKYTSEGARNALQNTIEWVEAEIRDASEWTEDGI